VSTSGSWDYSATASTIVQAALEDLGVVNSGGTPQTTDFALALTRLNLIAKQWQGKTDMAQGLKIWTRQRVSLFLTSGQVRYLIGPATTDDRASAATVVTLTSASRAASATALSVALVTGVTNRDAVGIVLSDGTLGWTTLSSGAGTTSWTLAANSLGASGVNAVVYTYTSKAQRFVDIEYAVLRDNSQTGQPIDLPIRIYTDVQEYERLPQKFAAGDPLAILVEPQRLNTAITCNFSPPNLYKNLRLTVIYPAEDYDSATGADDISFPQEWFAALEWELALRCAPMFGSTWTKEHDRNYVGATAIARELNPQNTSAYFQPNAESYDHR